MIFEIVTIFPEVFPGVLAAGLIGQAIRDKTIEIRCHNPRDVTVDVHRTVDDAPYGGGAGMVMKPEPLFASIENMGEPRPFVILLSPQGTRFNQQIARRIADQHDRVALICGRYEGVDERVRTHLADLDLSIGDFVLSGGEIAAMAVIESIGRLIPGVVGNTESVSGDSLEENLLKYPQYTRPRDFRGLMVPDILLSGNHAKIEQWRREQALNGTKTRRPDLFSCKTADENGKKPITSYDEAINEESE
jgi:tRNA (guanine37-N1)-methyltransferase